MSASPPPQSGPASWPTEIRLAADKRSLAVAYEDGASFALPAEYLRVMSPSAEVQGHAPSEKKTVPGKRDVQVLSVEPIGHYAVKLVFDDMHQTGLYTWAYLRRLGEEHEALWAGYLAELEAKGLSRGPPARRG